MKDTGGELEQRWRRLLERLAHADRETQLEALRRAEQLDKLWDQGRKSIRLIFGLDPRADYESG